MSEWTPEMEDEAWTFVCKPWSENPGGRLLHAALAEIRRMREERDRGLIETQSRLNEFQRRDRLDGWLAMQEKAAETADPHRGKCQDRPGRLAVPCPCGCDTRADIAAEIRALKAPMAWVKQKDRIDGSRAMHEKIRSALGGLLDHGGDWTASQLLALDRAYLTVQDLKPEDV